MHFTVIIRDKDDKIWCPVSCDWVDKRTESAHFYMIMDAMEAMKDMPREDKPRMRVMSLDVASIKYLSI